MTDKIVLGNGWFLLEDCNREQWWRWTANKSVILIKTTEYSMLDIHVSPFAVPNRKLDVVCNGITHTYIINSGIIISVNIDQASEVILKSETFVPQLLDKDNNDPRELGFPVVKFTLRNDRLSIPISINDVYFYKEYINSFKSNILDNLWSMVNKNKDGAAYIKNEIDARIIFKEWYPLYHFVIEGTEENLFIYSIDNKEVVIKLDDGINIVPVIFPNNVNTIFIKSSIMLYEIFSMQGTPSFLVTAENMKFYE